MIRYFFSGLPWPHGSRGTRYFDEQVKNGTSASAAALRATALAAKDGPQVLLCWQTRGRDRDRWFADSCDYALVLEVLQ